MAPLPKKTLKLSARITPVSALLGLALAQPGCADTIHNYYYTEDPGEDAGGHGGTGVGAGGGGEDTSGAGGDGGSSVGGEDAGGAGGDGGASPLEVAYPDAPKPDVEVSEHELALFEEPGTRFWLAVSKAQLERMNEGISEGGVIWDRPLDGDLYSPGVDNPTFVDHLIITAPGDNGQSADYGKVQVKIVGQSTRRAWSERSIPTLNLDADEFVDKQRIGGFEHLRLNNAQVGGIFREHLTLELYRRLGYPSPLSTYAWVSSNVWGKDIAIPYVLVERYKRRFCEREKEALGGGCVNMWEFVGDFAQDGDRPIPLKQGALPVMSVFDDPNNCQLERCDNSRVKQLEALLLATPPGPGFAAATEEFVDWEEFQRFQCLSWMFATGDDALHAFNNVVLVERADGKFQYLPYSVDLSLGHTWSSDVPLAGQNVLASGCQADEACWASTVATCEGLIHELTEMDPVHILDHTFEELESLGMLRDGDEPRYQFLRAWLEARIESLPGELDENREAPRACSGGMVDCGGYCDLPENCGVVPLIDLYKAR